MHLELLSWSATQPNTGAAAAAVTGDSLTIKNSSGPAVCLALWGMQQVSGWQQIVMPSGHDTTRGYRVGVVASELDLRGVLAQPLLFEPQELLSISIAGSNTAGDVELGSMLLAYDHLPGTEARLIDWRESQRRMVHLTTVSATITGAAAGYTGSELINAESDLLRANTDYALLGMETNTACGAVWITGPDTGNVRVGVPGNSTYAELTAGFFGTLSRAYDSRCIPVINSGNKNSTSIGILQNENNISPLVTLHLAELRK